MNNKYDGLREETVAYLKVRKIVLEATRAGDVEAVRYWTELMNVCASHLVEAR